MSFHSSRLSIEYYQVYNIRCLTVDTLTLVIIIHFIPNIKINGSGV